MYAGNNMASPKLFRICIPSPACCCNLWEVQLERVNVRARAIAFSAPAYVSVISIIIIYYYYVRLVLFNPSFRHQLTFTKCATNQVEVQKIN